MCGICGIAGQVNIELLTAMTEVLHHRGPDDSGVYCSRDRRIGLGNQRLSIIDLSSAGHMPMPNHEKNMWITYNGEVYNFPELRAGLEKKGYGFKSGTDTEVILNLYREYGTGAFERLNGMFALAILDETNGELVLARDRMGIKPLYYATIKQDFVFASEIKSLCLHPDFYIDLEPESIHYFLSHLWVPGPGTMFKGVYKLPPGHFLKWKDGLFQVQPYWEITWEPEFGRSESELAEELGAILHRAVKRHLISDVPLGLFLSGGLDSTTLLAHMHQISQVPVDVYTIAFRGEDSRLEQSAGLDAHYAEMTARHYGANFHRIEVDPDITELLPKVLWHLDEPVADPAAINTLLISQAARHEVTVLLSGQGADEVFGGYRVHLADRLARGFSRVPTVLRDLIIQPGLRLLPKIAGIMPGMHPGYFLAVERYFRKIIDTVPMSPIDRYLYHRTYYTQDQLLQVYHPDIRDEFTGLDGSARHREYFGQFPNNDFVNRMLHVDLKTFLPELNLTYGDKLSMAASIETRVPFLDNEVVEFMSRVPPDLKVRNLTGKYLLRQAVDGLVPPEVIKRRKAGFGAPIRKWLGKDLNPLLDEILSTDSVRSRGYFDPGAVSTMLAQHRAGHTDYTYQIWAFLTFEIWCRMNLDQTILAHSLEKD